MYNEIYFFALIPFLLLIVMLTFFSIEKVVLLIVFFVPLSVPLSEFVGDIGIDIYMPTEPILFGIMILFIIKILFEQKFDKKILVHPISIAIYFNLFWILFTSISSTIPMVSFKFLLSRLWFVVVFYFLATQVFTKINNINYFIWLYIIPFIIVIAYSLFRHSTFGLFNQEASNWVVRPFYNDHTSYGALIVMFIPLLFGFVFNKIYSSRTKFLIWVVIVIFFTALVFSYTRAAWLSLVGAIGVLTLVIFKIKFKYILIVAGILIVFLISFSTEIFVELEQNKQDSSEDIEEHIKSMSNIATDASNLERINRWKCALRMFAEKPILGWGPGTYMFNYAPFQFSYEKTFISTNAGDMGNAHSEYIGPLAESGIFGSLSFLIIIFATIYTAIKTYKKLENSGNKILLLTTLLGLITYYLHGFLNNFLDTDKASAPFWGFTAIIVAFDVYHNKNKESSNIEK
ncbi:MAG: O-antigen ligase family protein [Bacteroidetes bacterium]|nr:O-antigen ligase family protein [Bacteroidota bacterium]